MDNPIAPLERSNLFTGSGRVKPSQETDKEKERKKFSEDLEAELEDEEQARKRKDKVELASTVPDATEQESNEKSESQKPDEEQDAPRHVDLTA